MSHRRYYPDDLCPIWPNKKKCYHTINEAIWTQKSMQAHWPMDTFEVFKCHHCKHWHVGRKREEIA